MTEAKWGKYIVTRPKEEIEGAPWSGNLKPERSTIMAFLDSEVIKGAFYVECVWFWPTQEEDKGSPKPHKHDYDEVIAFFGTEFKDPHDLGAVIELWIDGEQNIIDKSFLAFVPAGVMHCPLNILSIDRPVFHFAVGTGKMYY